MSSEFDLLRNVTIGQYIPTGSPIHGLDPRAKLLAAGLLVFTVAFSRSIMQVLVTVAVILTASALSRIPFGYLSRSIRLALPILALIFVLQILFRGWEEPAGRIYFEWSFIRITRYSVQLMVLGILRVIGLLFLFSLLTMTSTTTELTHGVESLLQPFRRFGVPSHELALTNMIALRFVPTFAEEMEQIMKAQASRGAELSRRWIWRPDRALRIYLPLIVPLFIAAFRRAEDLVYAMEARGYIGGEGRTKFVTLHARPVDYVVVAGALLFFVLSIFIVPWPSLRSLFDAMGLGGIL